MIFNTCRYFGEILFCKFSEKTLEKFMRSIFLKLIMILTVFFTLILNKFITCFPEMPHININKNMKQVDNFEYAKQLKAQIILILPHDFRQSFSF